jgi:hypothetical protein
MPKTLIDSTQIRSVTRSDLDVTTVGGAVVAKIIAGTGVTVTSTGADSGTGDVTINASGGSTPTGTGFTHISAGVQDGASKLVDVSSADITGVLKAAAFPALTGAVTTTAGGLATTLATVPVSKGGTGATTLAVNGVVLGNGTSAVNVTSSGTAGQVFTSNGVSAPTFQAAAGGSTPTGTGFVHITGGVQDAAAGVIPFIFGDGSDGAVTFDGTTTILGIAPSSSTYTLTRDIFCTTITVNSGVTIKAAGYRIFANVSVTINSTGNIQNQGKDASGATAGGLSEYVTYTYFGRNGAAGVTSTSAGNNATNATTSYGGAGGSGGADGFGHAGGTGGTVTAPASTIQSIRSFPNMIIGSYVTRGTVNSYQCGAGGGSGGMNLGLSNSGGGGGGGGSLLICSPSIANSGTITCNGGAAAAPTSLGGCGGSGGGGGGVVVTVGNLTGTMPTATGGAHSTGINGGSDGTDGSAGNVFNFPM